MQSEEYKRPSFKDILGVLEPDHDIDFKQSSYYHNDFKKKLATTKKLEKQDQQRSLATIASRNDTYSYN